MKDIGEMTNANQSIDIKELIRQKYIEVLPQANFPEMSIVEFSSFELTYSEYLEIVRYDFFKYDHGEVPGYFKEENSIGMHTLETEEIFSSAKSFFKDGEHNVLLTFYALKFYDDISFNPEVHVHDLFWKCKLKHKLPNLESRYGYYKVTNYRDLCVAFAKCNSLRTPPNLDNYPLAVRRNSYQHLTEPMIISLGELKSLIEMLGHLNSD